MRRLRLIPWPLAPRGGFSLTMPAEHHTRPAAVAGLFYPGVPDQLAHLVGRLLDEASEPTETTPKALIVPHAGYPYSGPVAASAFRSLDAEAADRIRRVVLLGPSHFVPFAGVACSGARRFETPLGSVPVDDEVQHAIEQLPQVRTLPAAHSREHSLEVELPFLQTVLADIRIVPLVVGEASAEEVAEVLEHLWGAEETLVVVSSDLSHYLDYRTAQLRDSETCRAIAELRRTDLQPEEACGSRAINGLVAVARRRGLRVSTLDLRNSGDTAGPRDRVVGYGAWALS